MGRMLKALKRLEVDSPAARAADGLPDSEAPNAQSTAVAVDMPRREDGETPTTEGREPETSESGTNEDTASATDSTIAAALARVEHVAAEVRAEMEGETPPEVSAVVPTEPETRLKVGREPDAAVGDFPAIEWPHLPDASHREAHGRLAETILAQIPPSGATLAFTSPVGGEGKTEMLVTLAAALAERTDERVILIDGNLARPALARRVNARVSLGLGQVLSGVADWQQVVRKTNLRQLDLLPGMPSPELDFGPPEQLRLRSLLGQLRGVYGLVLVDAASLAHAEVAAMAACCDGTYLVVRLRQNTSSELTLAGEALRDGGCALLGSVAVG